MTDSPGTRFVDGLRVRPVHLNHLQSVLARGLDDLRHVTGTGRIGAGLRLVVEGGAVLLTAGVGFTPSGQPVRRDEATAITVPDGTDPTPVGVRAVSRADEATMQGDEPTIVSLLSEVVVPADTADPDTLVVGTVVRQGDGFTVTQDGTRFVPGPGHRHTGEWVQDETGVWRFDGVPIDIGDIEGIPGPAGPQGEPGPEGPQGPQGPPGPAGEQGPTGDLGPQGTAGATGERGERGPAGETGPIGATGPAGIPGGIGPQGPVGPQGEPGVGVPTKVTTLIALNWEQRIRMPMGQALQVLDPLQLDFTETLEPSFDSFAEAALHIVFLPSRPEAPMHVLGYKTAIDGPRLLVSVTIDNVTRRELGQFGGTVLVDLVCDFLQNTEGQPVSSSQSTLLQTPGPPMPGGLLRLTLTVNPG